MKIYRLFILAALLLSLACTRKDTEPNLPDKDDTEQGGEQGGDNTGDDNTGDDETDSPDAPLAPYDGERADDAYKDTVGDDEDLYWELNGFTPQVKVVYNGGTATVECDPTIAHYVEGAHAAVDFGDTKGVEIVVSGESTDGSLKIYGGKKYKLTLDGVSLASKRGPAINCQCDKRVFIHLADGTTNTLADSAEYADDAYYPDGTTADDEDRKGCFFAEGNMIVSGTGVLCVSGLQKHAIATDGYFYMRPGATVAILGAAKNGLQVKGDKKTLQGVEIAGGLLHATVASEAGKCVKTDYNVAVSGGRLLLKTTGDAIYDADENDTSSAAGVKCDGDMTVDGGYIQIESSGEGGKGISTDGAFVLNGGTIYVTTTGGKYVYNKAQDLDSSPKGIKAEGDIEINDGYLSISVTGRSDGSEGLESNSVLTMNGGEVVVEAYDDAVNAETGIIINGGKLYAYAENNDGIDSNGYLYLNGGLVIASGSAVPEEGFDCDNSNYFHITGGTLIGTGGAGIAPSTSATTQRTVLYNNISSATKGSIIAIVDADGKAVLLYELPRTWNQGVSLLFSSADFGEGTYTVYNGVSVSGSTENWHGWYGDGTWSAGTQVGSFTASSMVTTVGSSGGPGGGSPGGGGPGAGGRPW